MTKRRLMGCMAVGVLLAGWGWPPASVGDFEVTLTVREPAGVERQAAPVCGGVPLMKGAFKKDQPFAVYADSREIPAQVLPLVVDEKGFLRWVLVDLQIDVAANEARKFSLKAVAPVAKPALPLKLAVSDKEAAVDTGRIKFVVSKDKPFSLFSSLEAGGKPVVAGGDASYTDFTVPSAEKKRYVADKPERIEVQYEGPLRVTLKVTGRFVGDDDTRLRYIAWITAWAGRSDVFVKYALANSNPDQYVYRRIADSTVSLKLAEEVTKTTVGAVQPLEAGPESWLRQGLLTHRDYYGEQVATNAAIAGSGNRTLWGSAASKKPEDWAQGWIAARALDRAVWACDRFFFENPPRELAVEKGALVLRGVIERFEGPTLTSKDGKTSQILQPFRSKARWLLDCNRLSSEYVLDFAPPADPKALTAASKAARQLLHLLAPAEWYSETECFEIGKFCSEREELKCYDLWGWKYKPEDLPKGPAPWDFGGPHLRCVRGMDHHYETEHDALESLVLLYVRSGKRPHFEHAQAWANFGMDTEYFRTDGWRWKDGGIWWTKGGPAGGSSPQRPADPVTGLRAGLPPQWSQGWKHKDGAAWGPDDGQQVGIQADSRTCYCHVYGAGLAAWFCLTGEQDARDAVLDQVELNDDFWFRCRKLEPGAEWDFSRDFTRTFRLANAARLIAPADEFVIRDSDRLAQLYLRRPRPEPRGFVNAPKEVAALPKPADPVEVLKQFHPEVGDAGIADLKKRELAIDPDTGALEYHDVKNWHKWHPVYSPASFQYPMLYIAMDSYHRITGDEDARDWVIALGKAFAQLAYQRHGLFSRDGPLVDFPVRGIARDWASWNLSETNRYAEGVVMSGYCPKQWPDACARAYALCGEPMLKQRAYDYWFAGSHRGYNSKAMHNLGGVGAWLGYWGANEDSLVFTARTFYEHANPRRDDKPPKAVTDLAVRIEGGNAVVSFTAPADEGSDGSTSSGAGKVALYQVKCSGREIVDYERFLELFNAHKDEGYAARMRAANPTQQMKAGLSSGSWLGGYCNWWMAANLKGEPKPQAAGARESFVVTGLPEGARYFAVRCYDDSNNLSPMGNVVQAGK